jgi:hypothetical protein
MNRLSVSSIGARAFRSSSNGINKRTLSDKPTGFVFALDASGDSAR